MRRTITAISKTAGNTLQKQRVMQMLTALATVLGMTRVLTATPRGVGLRARKLIVKPKQDASGLILGGVMTWDAGITPQKMIAHNILNALGTALGSTAMRKDVGNTQTSLRVMLHQNANGTQEEASVMSRAAGTILITPAALMIIIAFGTLMLDGAQREAAGII